MKSLRSALALFLLATATAALAQSTAQKSFDQLKTLAGSWEGKTADDAGHMQRVVFTVIDSNHHTEDWTFADHGKETKEFFDLRRSEIAQK